MIHCQLTHRIVSQQKTILHIQKRKVRTRAKKITGKLDDLDISEKRIHKNVRYSTSLLEMKSNPLRQLELHQPC